MPSECKLNQSTIDVTLCALDFSFVFFCFLEVLFYSGYVFLLRSINSTLSASLENQASFSLVQGNTYFNSIDICLKFEVSTCSAPFCYLTGTARAVTVSKYGFSRQSNLAIGVPRSQHSTLFLYYKTTWIIPRCAIRLSFSISKVNKFFPSPKRGRGGVFLLVRGIRYNIRAIRNKKILPSTQPPANYGSLGIKVTTTAPRRDTTQNRNEQDSEGRAKQSGKSHLLPTRLLPARGDHNSR